MSKTLSMTLPDRVHAALATHAAREFEQEPSEFLRTFLINAGQNGNGATLKLELPPIVSAKDEAPDLFASTKP